MSDDLVLTERDMALAKIFQGQQSELEKSLAVAMTGVGRQIVKRPEILRGMAAADQLKAGYVVADESQAAELADLVAQVIDAERALTADVTEAARIPKCMNDALRFAVESVKNRLAGAKSVGNSARVEYQNTLRRRAAEETERLRQEAEQAAREAAAAAEAIGEDGPPPAEIAPPEVPRTFSGGTGRMGVSSRIVVDQIAVDMAKVPKEWLRLDPAIARAAFLAACAERKTSKPKPGEETIYLGVRFRTVEGAVNRR